MTSPQDKYAEAMRTSQAAVVEAFESWTKSAQSAIGGVPGLSVPQVEPQQVIDQVFDFAEKLLEVQRDFAKSLARTAAAASESARQQTESVVGAVQKHAEATTTVVKDAAQSAVDTAK
jgi:ElaB/YqjD/DUF883 family membrane-anchored ribosome-binding protein